MKYRYAFLAGVIVLAGCATVSQMEATGGSRSDGIVKLSFEYGMFDKLQLDQAAALQTARQRCAVWGYSDAEAFGGITRQCQAYSGTLGCTHWFVTKEYQCTMGSGAAVTQASAPMAPPLVQGQVSTPAQGPRMVRAKTASGYCLDVPDGYSGTGAANSPVVTSAMPRCDQLSTKDNSSSFRRDR